MKNVKYCNLVQSLWRQFVGWVGLYRRSLVIIIGGFVEKVGFEIGMKKEYDLEKQ